MAPKWQRPLTAEELALVDERINRTYDKLHKWVRTVTYSEQIQGSWIMDAEELFSEAWVVVCKVARVYLSKEWDEYLVLVKASINNMIGAQRYKACLTHRKSELHALELDRSSTDSELAHNTVEEEALGDILPLHRIINTFGDSSYAMACDPAQYVESAERILELSNQLSELDYQVLDVLLGNNALAEQHIKLAAARKTFTYKNPVITITPLIVARTLGQPVAIIEESFERLRGIYGSV